MRAVVTGGAGFIGSHLVEQLVDDGAEVAVIDSLVTGDRDAVPDAATFHELDVRETDEVSGVFEDADIVYHLAAHTDVRESADDHDIDFASNVAGTKSVLDTMRRSTVSELVFTSSSTVYGEADTSPIPEDYGPLQPISHYGATKLAAESLASAYSHLFDIDVTVLRLANIVGERAGKGVIPDFRRKLEQDPDELEVLGDGRQEKSYLHVDDCITAIRDLPDTTEGCTVFNVGAEDAVTVTEIAEIVIDAMGVDADITYTGGERGWKGDVPAFLLDIHKAKQQGWAPSMRSEAAVRAAAEF